MASMRRRSFIATLLAGGLLVACTPEADPSDGGEESDRRTDPDEAVATASFRRGDTKISVGVRPIVRSGKHLVLTLDLTATAAAADLERDIAGHDVASEVASHWGDGWAQDPREFLGVRLVDLAGDKVASTAVDSAGKTVCLQTDGKVEKGDSGRRTATGTVQIAFGDPGASELAVYAQELALVRGIPVVDDKVPSIEGAGKRLDLSLVEEAPVSPMLSVSQDLAQPIREERNAETSTVQIGSDVLFASGSAELDAAADAVLDDVARRVEAHKPGPVEIVGHTDDVDTDSFNLTLSRNRADAVVAALGERLDDGYQLSPDGRGESEPIAANDTEDGKALNRRVEVTMTTPLEDPAESTAELPEFEGQTGTAADGVKVTTDDEGSKVPRPYTVELEGARMVDGHLLVTLTATAQDDEVDGVYGIGQFDIGTGLPEEPDGVSEYTLLASDGAVGVLVGSIATYPAFYRAGGPEKTTRPLTGLSLNTRADGGVPRVIELVYPRGVAGVEPGAAITLQYSGHDGPWRMTKVPIRS